jgi:hypothetical protein
LGALWRPFGQLWRHLGAVWCHTGLTWRHEWSQKPCFQPKNKEINLFKQPSGRLPLPPHTLCLSEILFLDKLSLASPEQLLIIIVYRLIVASFMSIAQRIVETAPSILPAVECYRKTAF